MTRKKHTSNILSRRAPDVPAVPAIADKKLNKNVPVAQDMLHLKPLLLPSLFWRVEWIVGWLK